MTTSPESDKVILLGHSHIDLAFLWTKDETINLILPGTVNYTLKLMDEFPRVTYAQGSAQIYDWIEKNYPELFKKIREKVKSGQWEVVGGTWSEFSPNLIGEETMIRQFLYGKKYFRAKFGVDPCVGWLPDSFGFPWTMPQVLIKSGIKFFLTSKLNWQLYLSRDPTPFPYHAFWWTSPDGSRVLTYLTVGDADDAMRYDGPVRKNYMLSELEELKRKDGINVMLYLYGYGDHGGGIVKYMIKDAECMQKIPGSPHVEFGTARSFFHELYKLSGAVNLPEHKDELYLKTHMGTFTTESRVKRALRDLEQLLVQSEMLSVIAHLSNGFTYPREKLEEAWKKLLFMSTHDIADGTSIKEVYEELFSEEYADCSRITRDAIDASMKSLVGSIKPKAASRDHLIAFNPLPWKATTLVSVPIEENWNANMGKYLAQIERSEGQSNLWLLVKDLPPLGLTDLTQLKAKEEAESSHLYVEQNLIENDFYIVEIDAKTGLVSRIFDKRLNIELLDKSRRGNVLQLYEDIPPNAPGGEPAWNMYLYDKAELSACEKIEVTSKGPLVGEVSVVRRYGKSKFEQRIALINGLPVVRFTLKAFWEEKYSTLKVSFPLSLSSRSATYGIQFGAVERFSSSYEGTTEHLKLPNRPWKRADMAKVEVPAHRWANVDSEDQGYGVALIAREKYGFSHEGNELKLTLLRGPRRRDPFDDRWVDQSSESSVGEHVITYWIYSHKGNWEAGEVPKVGYELTTQFPVFATPGSLPPNVISFLHVEPAKAHIVITSIKLAEESDDTVIRLYNPYDFGQDLRLCFANKVEDAYETDMIERIKIGNVAFHDREVTLQLKPFEIKTIRLKFGEADIAPAKGKSANEAHPDGASKATQLSRGPYFIFTDLIRICSLN